MFSPVFMFCVGQVGVWRMRTLKQAPHSKLKLTFFIICWKLFQTSAALNSSTEQQWLFRGRTQKKTEAKTYLMHTLSYFQFFSHFTLKQPVWFGLKYLKIKYILLHYSISCFQSTLIITGDLSFFQEVYLRQTQLKVSFQFYLCSTKSPNSRLKVLKYCLFAVTHRKTQQSNDTLWAQPCTSTIISTCLLTDSF